MRLSRYLIGLGLSVGLLHSCGNPYDSLSDPFFGSNVPFGLVPEFSNSLQDYKDKVGDFDDQYSSDSYKKNSQLDPDLGGTGYSEENPFDFDTPAKDSMGENSNYVQLFRNLKDVMDYGLVVGNLRMLVTVAEQSGSSKKSINTLILPEGFQEEDLIGVAELVDPGNQYQYKESVEPRVFCSIASVDVDTGDLEKIVDLPSALDMDARDMAAGDPYCPVETLDVDYVAGDNGEITLKVKTEPLPFYEETRRSIASLSTYGFAPDREYALLYELKFETENPSEETQYLIYSFYYIITPVILTPPTELGSYKYVGSFNDHEYYLILSRHPMTFVKAQAALLQKALGASKTYGVDINSQAEQNFINGRIPGERVWMGLDDMQNEGKYKPHAGGAAFTVGSGSHYQNWSNGNPNDDGNEDGIHLNYGTKGKWNDTETDNSYIILMEAEFNTENEDFR